ncbi:MAG TPA: gliding motility-associated ABC transporter substrate-binding protein GldG [Bacteroidales bacterium]|nr:gliding motility-associated ABC transporter substrate-binding protein GldG [Bacteroidales bacterium]
MVTDSDIGKLTKRNMKRVSLIKIIPGLLIIVLINIIGTYLYFRLDLTAEKRYTLSPATKKLLGNVDDLVFFRIFLYGDYPAGFKRLERETRDMLNEFRAYNKNIEFKFVNPSESQDGQEREKIFRQLMEKGLEPTDLQVRTKEGTSQKIIFPGALVSFQGREVPLSLLTSRRGTPPDEILNNSIENLEFVLADAIRRLVSKNRPRIAFIEGHGELNNHETADARVALNEYYVAERVILDGKLNALTDRVSSDSASTIVRNKYEAIIIAKPDSAFSEKDKFIIDQYIMRGGKVFWLIDPVQASMDSLQLSNQTMGLSRELNLTDMFFKYGFRINNELVMDLSALSIPVKTGQIGNEPKFDFFPWHFFPIITPQINDHIVRNLNAIKTEFVSTIDFVQSEKLLKKDVLLHSSKYSRTVRTPLVITLDILGQKVDERLYNKEYLPIAVKIEGEFESLYKNRIPAEISEDKDIDFRETSKSTKMVIVADGDVIRNQLQFSQGNYIPLPLGYDRYTGQQFGNKDFVLNVMNYLTEDSSLISIRSRELKLRLLDKTRAEAHRIFWQLFNIGVPIILVLIFGIIQVTIRKNIYAK